MTAPLTRVSRMLAAAALASLSAAAPALADPVPPPPSQPSGPVAMPYPNAQARQVYSADPMEGGQVVHSADPMEGGQVAAPGTAAHKHIAGVKYEDFAKAGDAQVIEVQSISWGKVGDAGTVYSADPMEGGQIARRTHPGKPTYGDVTFTKQTDVSSPKVMSTAPATEPGKVEYPNVQVAGVDGTTAKTTATFTTLAGKCVKGKHLNSVTITMRSASYTLRDAVVTDVTPADDGMETVSLTYASRD